MKKALRKESFSFGKVSMGIDYNKSDMSCYSQIIKKIESRKGMNHPLDDFRTLLHKHLPEPEFIKIQVAGTNGKGSVCQWMARLLEIKDVRTGLFISPHLIDHAERIQIDGVPIPHEQFVSIYGKWERFFEDHSFTMFEIDLWISLVWFMEKQVQTAIFETGLGGKKDAVTALNCPYEVLTNIGYDHMNLLGNTLEEITLEKCGILHEDPLTLLFTAEKDEKLLKIIHHQADLVQAEVVESQVRKDLDLPGYQKENFSLAFDLVSYLGYSYSQQELEWVFLNFNHPGRFMILNQSPLLLLDGAHNEQGIEALVAGIIERGLRIEQVFFSVLADKKAHKMIRELSRLGAEIILVSFESERLADLEKLADTHGLALISFEQMCDQLNKRNTLCCGSLYFIGALLKFLQEEVIRDE